jgi:deoxyribodipyrimidine photo-lyase
VNQRHTRIPTTSFSDLRIRAVNAAPLNPAGEYVLYWMIAARRSRWNFALQRAAEVARKLDAGLLVFEPLRCDYPYASQRLHRFVIEGMRDQAADFTGTPTFYYPYVEAAVGAGQGLLEALADAACLVVTDDFPAFSLPRTVQSVGRRLKVPLEAIDGNGLLPLELIEKPYPTAYAFRRYLHRALAAFIDDRPQINPLQGRKLKAVRLPERICERWPVADIKGLLAQGGLAALSIDQQVSPAPTEGGAQAARSRLNDFLEKDLADYVALRNVPDLDRTSGLSPYLHFGHISVHQVFDALAKKDAWESTRLSLRPTGQKSGWWGMSEGAEAFIDELVTWRELGYGFCRLVENPTTFASLPAWARKSLDLHRADPRSHLYSLEAFEQAATHDPLWNAAQHQLRREGRIHGYLRMLWGKKILEWTPDPETALEVMFALNDRYALDGRDPNSVSGITWCLGRFDRAWGPERPVYGKVRYMTSQNTARKVAVKGYLKRYGPIAMIDRDPAIFLGHNNEISRSRVAKEG